MLAGLGVFGLYDEVYGVVVLPTEGECETVVVGGMVVLAAVVGVANLGDGTLGREGDEGYESGLAGRERVFYLLDLQIGVAHIGVLGKGFVDEGLELWVGEDVAPLEVSESETVAAGLGVSVEAVGLDLSDDVVAVVAFEYPAAA